MKKILFLCLLCMVVALFQGIAQAAPVPITFDEVPIGSTDPTIKGVSFWAGSPLDYYDTVTDESWSPDNPYLVNGIADGTHAYSPTKGSSLIGMSSSFMAGSYALDLRVASTLPVPTTLYMQALSSGSQVASDIFNTSDNIFHPVSLSSLAAFDTFIIYSDTPYFHLDNLIYSSPPPPPPPSVPEPSTLLLLCFGFLPLVAFSRRKKRD